MNTTTVAERGIRTANVNPSMSGKDPSAPAPARSSQRELVLASLLRCPAKSADSGRR
jgi:hypothetical protein